MKKHIITIAVSALLVTSFAYLCGSHSRTFQQISVFRIGVFLATAIQILAFIPSALFNTERFYDLTGSITYLSIVAFCTVTSQNLSLKQLIAACMVGIWTIRLGSFLFIRILKVGEDSRFVIIKKSKLYFFSVWCLQGLWVTITIGPALAIMTTVELSPEINMLEWLGIGIWLIGFMFEVVADQQKYNFKFDPRNKGKFIQEGLWKISRHPNYFGQIVLWGGVAIFSISSLKGLNMITLVSPIFVYFLLTKLSGVPLLQKKAEKTWGGQPTYQRYKSLTPILIPNLFGSQKEEKLN